MKGVLEYYEPAPELNYPGGWIVNEGEGVDKTTYKLSEDSMKWILENSPPKRMDVVFTVRTNCYFCEDTKIGHHEIVADLKIN